jgi:hypothetical protein
MKQFEIGHSSIDNNLVKLQNAARMASHWLWAPTFHGRFFRNDAGNWIHGDHYSPNLEVKTHCRQGNQSAEQGSLAERPTNVTVEPSFKQRKGGNPIFDV